MSFLVFACSLPIARPPARHLFRQSKQTRTQPQTPTHPPPRRRPRDRFPIRPTPSSRYQRVQPLGDGRRRVEGRSLSAPGRMIRSGQVFSACGRIGNQEGIVRRRRAVPDRRSCKPIIFASFGFSREAVFMLIGMALLKLEFIRPGVPLHLSRRVLSGITDRSYESNTSRRVATERGARETGETRRRSPLRDCLRYCGVMSETASWTRSVSVLAPGPFSAVDSATSGVSLPESWPSFPSLAAAPVSWWSPSNAPCWPGPASVDAVLCCAGKDGDAQFANAIAHTILNTRVLIFTGVSIFIPVLLLGEMFLPLCPFASDIPNQSIHKSFAASRFRSRCVHAEGEIHSSLSRIETEDQSLLGVLR
jgi:hypothetical protein